jgi:hypothetical protein
MTETMNLQKFSTLPEELKELKQILDIKSRSPFKVLEALAEQNTDPKYLKSNLNWAMDRLYEWYSNIHSRNNLIGFLRKIYNKNFPGNDTINKILDLSKQEKVDKQKLQDKQLTKNLSQKIEFNYQDIQKLMNKIKKKDNIADAVITLQLALGRRLIEILKIIDLPQEAEKKQHVIIDKTAKQGGKGSRKDFTIPLLFLSYPEMKERFEYLRRELDIPANQDKTNAQITNKYKARVIRKMREYFGAQLEGIKNLGTHLNRKLYAKIASLIYKPQRMDSSVYYSNILGHKKDSTGSALYYKNIIINGLDETPKQEEEKEPDIEVPENLKEIWEVYKDMVRRGKSTSYREIQKRGFGSQKVRDLKFFIKELVKQQA